MDPLSLTAGIIAVLDLTYDVTRYLNNVVNAPRECQQCVEEASNLIGSLTCLKYRAEKAHVGDEWFQQLRLLNAENGPLQQYEQALQLLQSRTETRSRTRNIKRHLLWKFEKEEIVSILRKIERLKSLISVALEMDHL